MLSRLLLIAFRYLAAIMGMDGGHGDGGSVQLLSIVRRDLCNGGRIWVERVGLLFPRLVSNSHWSLKQGLMGRLRGKAVSSIRDPRKTRFHFAPVP